MLGRGLRGPQMLAFLPAICLAAYWGGGEALLVFCALTTPLLFALTGGFGRLPTDPTRSVGHRQTVEAAAQEFLEIAQHNGQTTACFQLGISGLDDIAAGLGETVADEARQLLSARLASILRETDELFQVGDKRLAILIAPGFRLKLDTLLDLAKRMRDVAEEPLSLSGTTRYVSVSVGIASSLTFGRNATAQQWLSSAAFALDEAIATGGSATRVWSDKLSRQRQSRRDLHHDIITALETGQIQAFFQPQIRVKTGDVVGMEALARWDHPTRGCIAPSEFLQAILDSGQMDRLGQTMLSQALGALQGWDDAGLDVPTVSVNLSGAELRNPDLAAHIATDLDRAGLGPARLVIEVLESVISGDTDDIIRRNLVALADLGCRIDLDDFGTGHASITTLQHFPIQRVKIDQSFVQRADRTDDKRRMLAAILRLTDTLELDALAEGVETIGEHGLLRELDCRFAQGFLFAEPATAADVTEWLRQHQARDAATGGAHLRRVK